MAGGFPIASRNSGVDKRARTGRRAGSSRGGMGFTAGHGSRRASAARRSVGTESMESMTEEDKLDAAAELDNQVSFEVFVKCPDVKIEILSRLARSNTMFLCCCLINKW